MLPLSSSLRHFATSNVSFASGGIIRTAGIHSRRLFTAGASPKKAWSSTLGLISSLALGVVGTLTYQKVVPNLSYRKNENLDIPKSGSQENAFEIQLENDSVSVVRAKIMPNKEIGLHRDAHQQVVVALQGGVITRLEKDGSTVDVKFPTGQAVFREIDPPDEFHRSLNNSSAPVELIIIQLKK